jgi:uncharacterized protein
MKTGDIVGGPVRHDYEPTQIVTSAVDSIEARHWALALHFSLLAGYVIPFAGLVIPICIWQIKKGEFPVLNDHGKNAMNGILSYLLYVFVGIALSLVLIGIPILIIVGLASVAFPIIAGIKANNGKVWSYPFTIRFL